MRNKPMMWIAYDPIVGSYKTNREQFNGDKAAWGESEDDWKAKQGVDVPQMGDELMLRMGMRTVYKRRLCLMDEDDSTDPYWYWTIFVR